MVFQCQRGLQRFRSGPRAFGETLHGYFAADDPAENHLFVSYLMLLYFSAFGWLVFMGKFGAGRGRGAQEPFLSPEVCFLKLFFNPVGLCKEAWKVATPFKAVETRPSFGESLFFHIFPKSVVYFWILHDKFFSISSLEVVDAEGCNSKRFKALGTQDIPKAPRLQRNDLLRRLPSRKNAMRSITLEFETFAGFVILVT